MTEELAQTGAACKVCGHSQLVAGEHQNTRKVRRKFGLFYILLSLTLIGFPIALILWLAAPRKTEVISTDRWLECTSCGAKQ